MSTAINDPGTDPDHATVDLALLWRAGALITGDAGAGRVIAARVARSVPRPDSARESTLLASFLLELRRWREVTSAASSPEPLALSEHDATVLAGLRRSLRDRALEVVVLRDALRVSPSVLSNAMPDEDFSAVATPDGSTIEAFRSISGIPAEPFLDKARAEMDRAASRRKKFAAAQFVAFALVVGLLVYVKIDLKKAADEEKAARVPSMVEQFSNPLPPEPDENE